MITKKSILFYWASLLFVCNIYQLDAQKVYTTSGGELILQSGQIEQNNESVNTNIRLTWWFHSNEYLHFDVIKNAGLFTGISVRNIGFITDEDEIKIKYRSYSLGLPLALKIGSLPKNFFIFGGAEYEWLFHFKQKVFVEGEKRKYSEWFSNHTQRFIPSVFAGIQFPGGLNLKFRYYLDDFLNHSYHGSSDFSDFRNFTKTQLWTVSMSYQMKNSKIRKEVKERSKYFVSL
jgi:hypothetical protein